MSPETMLALALGHQQVVEEQSPLEIEKVAHQSDEGPSPSFSLEEKVEMADQWGRELALQDFEKTAAGLLGRGLTAALNAGAGARTAVGAGAGAVSGAANYALKTPEERKQTSLGRQMFGGAALGAGAGAASAPVAKAVGSTRTGAGRAVRNAVKNDLKQRPGGAVDFSRARAAQSYADMSSAARAKSPAMATRAPAPAAGAVRPEVQRAAAAHPAARETFNQDLARRAVEAKRIQNDIAGAQAAATAPVKRTPRPQ